MKKHKILIAIIIFIFSSFVVSSDNKSFWKKINLVPNEETAIKIAEAVWLPIYDEHIYSHKPFIAKDKKTYWIVKGTLPKGYKGGVPYIEIRKSDCKILKVEHGK